MLERHRYLNQIDVQPGTVVCWLSRDLRASDNWALHYAQTEAISRQQPLWVVFCLQRQFLGALPRHFSFMLSGLIEMAADLAERQIPFCIKEGDPSQVIPSFCRQVGAGLLVCDFSPLRLVRQWRTAVAGLADLPVIEVDAHNIIPCWTASPHQEFGAYTLRPKIKRQLSAWLTGFPSPASHPFPPALEVCQAFSATPAVTMKILQTALNRTGAADPALPRPGSRAGLSHLTSFIKSSLIDYPLRNDPNRHASSGLSPWLHFGQVAPQRAAYAVHELLQQSPDDPGIQTAGAAFLEELIVRRELADNFCFYNMEYDRFDGFPEWARRTLRQHQADPRPLLYNEAELENAATADPLWNAAQRDLVTTGQMPGYLRMYWAKKILEWSIDPEAAQATAILLNDRYFLDGRDPNGYTGIAWSIGGVHDRAWGERPVFGKIRTMTFNGCRRKFDVESYIRSVDRLDCNI